MKTATYLTILLLILDSSFLVSSSASGATPPPALGAYADHAFSLLSSESRVALGALQKATSNDTSVASLEGLIQAELLQYGVRQVLLDIGWQNYTVGHIPYEQWVDNWLTASDVLGVQNLLYVSPLTSGAIGSPWVMSAIKTDPSIQTYYPNDTAANYISPDNSDVARLLESDLATIYSYYESHTSLAGLSTGASDEDPYYGSNSTVPILGYSNSSLASFTNSVYFSRDTNGSGIDLNGSMDLLWETFKNIESSPVLSYGIWQISETNPVYGNGSDDHVLAMRFYLASQQNEILTRWYGDEMGSPGDLLGSLYRDQNGSFTAADPMATQTFVPSSTSATTGWQAPMSFPGNFSSGYYWIEFSSPSSNDTNNYGIYARAYQVGNATSLYILPTGYEIRGSSILWIEDSTGTALTIYPYQQVITAVSNLQTFTAAQTFDFNTIFLFLKSRPYDPANGTLTVVDMTTGETLASGVLSQDLTYGVQGWTPITLNNTVVTLAGHQYGIQLTEPNLSWVYALGDLSVNPPSDGFQGQSQSWLFQLADVNFSQEHLDHGMITSNGMDGVRSGYEDALRLLPSLNETLTTVQILMDDLSLSNSSYSQGNLIVSLWTSDANGSRPIAPLEAVSLPADRVPKNGWINASGFNQTVAGGTYYWIVLSTNSSTDFSLARLTNLYKSLVLVSSDNGKIWTLPKEGPTGLSYRILLTGEIIQNAVDAIPQITIGTSGGFAQSFIASEDTQAQGVYLGLFAKYQVNAGSYLVISIRPGNGQGQPSQSILASGEFSANNMTIFSNEYVQFTSVARLTAGQTYWIVVEPVGGSFDMYPMVYENGTSSQPTGDTALLSDDGGVTWKAFTNGTAILSYAVASIVSLLPSYSTSVLYNDLVQNHDANVSELPLRGWNAYVQTSQLAIYHNITQWFDNFTGRTWTFYLSASSIALEALRFRDISLLAPDKNSTCQGLASELVGQVPLDGDRFPSLGNGLFPPLCGSALAGFSQIMNYMSNVGLKFGFSTASRVLIVGSAAAENLTLYLSNSFNASFVDTRTDPNLLSLPSFKDYQVVVWGSNSSVPSSVQVMLTKYVQNGGTLLILGSPPTALSSLVGFDWQALPSSNSPASAAVSREFSSFVGHIGYANGLQVAAISNVTALAKEAGLLMGLNDIGNGEVVFLHFDGLSQYAQVSNATILISNVIFGRTVGNGSAMWYGSPEQASSGLIYGVYGLAGRALLLWLSNPSARSASVTLTLNGTYYGVASNWQLLDSSNLTVTRGGGNNVSITTTIGPGEWKPIYILPYFDSLTIKYASVAILRQLVYPKQALYSLEGFANQSAIVAVNSNKSIAQVVVNNQRGLVQVSSIGSLSSEREGWYLDNATSTLFIKFVSSGTDLLRILQVTPTPVTPVLLPYALIELVLVSLICIEIGYLAFRYRKGSRKSPRDMTLNQRDANGNLRKSLLLLAKSQDES